MKNLITLIFILVGLSVNAQTLKTYSGAYPLMFLSVEHNGKATYTYKERDDGERIYHGNFKYSDYWNTLSGNFNNNKQDGQWVRVNKTNAIINGKNFTGTIKTTITYKNGVLDGLMTITATNNDGIKIATLFSGTIKGDKIIGSVSFTPNERIGTGNSVADAKYQYLIKGNFDEYGNPMGKWVVQNPTTRITEEYNKDGSIVCSMTNTATGDKEDNHYGPMMADYAIEIVNKSIREISMRDSFKGGIPEIKYNRHGWSNSEKTFFYTLPLKSSIIEIEYDRSSGCSVPEDIIIDICEYLLNYKSINHRNLNVSISVAEDKIVYVDGAKKESGLQEYLLNYKGGVENLYSYCYSTNKQGFKVNIRLISPYVEDVTGLTSHYIIKDSELDAEIEQLKRWESEGFPIFSDFGEDEHLTPVSLVCNPNYIKSDLNDYEEYIMPYRKYDDRINYKNENGFGTSYLHFNVYKNGEITNEKVSGSLSKVLKPSKYFSVNKPASYHFERLDTTISVPCSVKIPIEEVGVKIADGWIDLKYNKKKNTWKVKSLNDIYIPKDLIPTIEEYFQFFPDDMGDGVNYREGKHRLHIGVFKHKAIVAEENEIDLNPVVIIFSK